MWPITMTDGNNSPSIYRENWKIPTIAKLREKVKLAKFYKHRFQTSFGPVLSSPIPQFWQMVFLVSWKSNMRKLYMPKMYYIRATEKRESIKGEYWWFESWWIRCHRSPSLIWVLLDKNLRRYCSLKFGCDWRSDEGQLIPSFQSADC